MLIEMNKTQAREYLCSLLEHIGDIRYHINDDDSNLTLNNLSEIIDYSDQIKDIAEKLYEHLVTVEMK